MPYKDQEKRKKVNRESMQRSRGTQTKGTQLPDFTESMLEAVNVVLERKGMPRVHKGVEPSLPFGKKLQASRKRM